MNALLDMHEAMVSLAGVSEIVLRICEHAPTSAIQSCSAEVQICEAIWVQKAQSVIYNGETG